VSAVEEGFEGLAAPPAKRRPSGGYRRWRNGGLLILAILTSLELRNGGSFSWQRDPHQQARGNRSGWGDPAPAHSVGEARWRDGPRARRGPRHTFDFLRVGRVLRLRHGKDFLFLGSVQGNIVGQLEVSKKLLAMRASQMCSFQEFNSSGAARAHGKRPAFPRPGTHRGATKRPRPASRNRKPRQNANGAQWLCQSFDRGLQAPWSSPFLERG